MFVHEVRRHQINALDNHKNLKNCCIPSLKCKDCILTKLHGEYSINQVILKNQNFVINLVPHFYAINQTAQSSYQHVNQCRRLGSLSNSLNKHKLGALISLSNALNPQIIGGLSSLWDRMAKVNQKVRFRLIYG